MIVTQNEHIVAFDVDDTLVMWSWSPEFDEQAVTFDNFGYATRLLPHSKHIELLKQFKARGHYVIVWSQGGWQWAHEVIKKLQLENFVDEVKTKPQWAVDDLPPNSWLTRTYIKLDDPRDVAQIFTETDNDF